MRGCGWFKAPSKEEREGDDMDLVGEKMKVGKDESGDEDMSYFLRASQPSSTKTIQIQIQY